MPDIFTTGRSGRLNKARAVLFSKSEKPAITTAQHASKDILKSESANIDQDSPESQKRFPSEHKTPGIFSSLIKYPRKFSFVHQDKNEQIILFVRRHFAVNFLWITISVITAALPLFIFTFLTLNGIFLPLSFILILTTFYYLIVIGYAFYNFIEWFYNIGIITQKRIIDIDFIRLSYIDVAITQLPEIEDVVHKQKGFFASFFDYGDVIAHTVAGQEDFIFEKIPRPALVTDLLSKMIAD
jgi:hypothetical protein